MEIKQPNDVFAAVLQKQDANVFDLAASDMVSTNTQLLAPEEYKNNSKVQEIFKDAKGGFDEQAFNAAYSKASTLYTEINQDHTLAKALEYDPTDFTAPLGSKKMDVRPIMVKDANPFKDQYS